MGKLLVKGAFFAVCVSLVGISQSITNVRAEDVSSAVISGQASVLDEEIDTERTLGGFSYYLDEYYSSMESEAETEVSAELMGSNTSPGSADKLLPAFNGITVAKVQDYVNVRSAADVKSELVGRLYRGGIGTVVSTEGEWTQIKSGDVEGYVKSEYLLFDEDAEKFSVDYYDNYVRISSETLNVRIGPGTDYGIVTELTQGVSLRVLERLDGWFKVALGEICQEADEGYVSSEYVSEEFRYAMTQEDALELDKQNSYNIHNMIWPLPSDHRIGSYFGYRKAPTWGASTFHKGLDIGGAKGSEIVAVLSGTVINASYSSSAGYYVEISHGNGVVTRYLHNSKLLVSAGQQVMQGDTISLVGSTGTSTSSHLHFSVVINGTNVDPYPYLKKVH